MPAGSRDRAVIGDILARLDSLDEMVHDLLLFARPRAPRMSHVPIVPLVEATALLLRKDPSFPDVDVVMQADRETVEADSELLQIVVWNLPLSAAMAGKGRVTVSVERSGRPMRARVPRYGAGHAAAGVRAVLHH
jgi:signal transduction histidine kinase